MTNKSQEIINELKEEGFESDAIKDALEDGQFCGQLIDQGYTEEDIEDAYNAINYPA